MKPLLWFLVVIPFFFSCRKKEFISCPNFEKIVGEWQCFDTETTDYLLIKENGTLIFFFNMERKNKYCHSLCEYVTMNKSIYFTFREVNNYSNTIELNTSLDTLTIMAASYDQNANNVGYKRRYIKVQ